MVPSTISWAWLGLAALLIAGLGLAIALLRRRRGADAPEPEPVPQIEPPIAAKPVQQSLPLDLDPPPAPPAPDRASPLALEIEAWQLAISLTAATLSYRLTLTNRGSEPLGEVRVSGDMISAHSSLPDTEQIAHAEMVLAPCHVVERLEPGESVLLEGELRLPFTRIRAIYQGDAALFVPLARMKAQAAGEDGATAVQTALVGQRGEREGGAVLPFRLNLGPRLYREVTQRIFS